MPHPTILTLSRATGLFALAAIALVLAPLSRAQSAGTGVITGHVLNQSTREYLRAAVVSIPDADLSVVTEAGGAFQVLHVPAGTHRMVVTYVGLDSYETTITVTAGQIIDREVPMTSVAYDKEVVKLGAFVVASEREGIAKAVNEQKNSLDMKSVLASDSFGDVSEGNVAEFLKFMPGISVDYVEADARAISIGGMDPKYTTVLMDGQPISAAGSSAIATGRTFEFEQLSIASIETVELSKTPTPDVSGSAMAGIVNLRSKGAFDRKGRQVRWGASGALNGMDMSLARTAGIADGFSRKVMPNYYLEYSDLFLGNKLGIIAGYNYSYTFAEQKVQQYGYTFDNNPGNNATEVPRISSLLLNDSPKSSVRQNFNVRMDYKVSPNLWFWARMDYNTYSAKFFSRAASFALNSASTVNGPGGPKDATTEYSLLSQTNTATSVNINGSGGGTDKHGFTGTPNAGLSYKLGRFSMEAQAQYSLATNWYSDISEGFLWNATTNNIVGAFRISRPDAKSFATTITQLTGPDWRNLANYAPGFSVVETVRAGKDTNYSGKADFRYAATMGLPVLLKWGINSNEHTRYIPAFYQRTIVHVGADHLPNTADDAPALYAETNYRETLKMGGNLDGIPSLDRFALGREMAAHPDWYVFPTAATDLAARLKSINLIREQIDAVYLQPIVKVTSRLDIAPGFRVERTKGFGLGPSDIGDALARLALTGSRTGTVDTNSADYILARYSPVGGHFKTYSTPLKYLHANFKFTKDLLLRASYNESITRPDLNRLIPGISGVNDTADPHTVSLGNPDLRPERARNIYLSLEYYLKNAGFASASFARRDIRDLIRTTTFVVPIGGNFWGDPFWDGYQVSSVDNVAKAHNESLEINYRSPQFKSLPEYLSGLGFFANGTWIHYDDINTFLRPRSLANGGLSYRWRKFSSYWRVNWSSKQQTSTISAAGVATFHSPRTMQDVGADFAATKGISLFLTGRNVFNTPGNEDYYGRPEVITRRGITGALWTIGVKGVF